ncbi:unnamed protein product [Calicophoron daubneyi]|uniref:Uncharacterized protein n=1 Tax=Calicophoron daubneyi TaxID=300641 RepID=A0AAV2TDZ3_CALDB
MAEAGGPPIRMRLSTTATVQELLMEDFEDCSEDGIHSGTKYKSLSELITSTVSSRTGKKTKVEKLQAGLQVDVGDQPFKRNCGYEPERMGMEKIQDTCTHNSENRCSMEIPGPSQCTLDAAKNPMEISSGLHSNRNSTIMFQMELLHRAFHQLCRQQALSCPRCLFEKKSVTDMDTSLNITGHPVNAGLYKLSDFLDHNSEQQLRPMIGQDVYPTVMHTRSDQSETVKHLYSLSTVWNLTESSCVVTSPLYFASHIKPIPTFETKLVRRIAKKSDNFGGRLYSVDNKRHLEERIQSGIPPNDLDTGEVSKLSTENEKLDFLFRPGYQNAKVGEERFSTLSVEELCLDSDERQSSSKPQSVISRDQISPVQPTLPLFCEMNPSHIYSNAHSSLGHSVEQESSPSQSFVNSQTNFVPISVSRTAEVNTNVTSHPSVSVSDSQRLERANSPINNGNSKSSEPRHSVIPHRQRCSKSITSAAPSHDCDLTLLDTATVPIRSSERNTLHRLTLGSLHSESQSMGADDHTRRLMFLRESLSRSHKGSINAVQSKRREKLSISRSRILSELKLGNSPFLNEKLYTPRDSGRSSKIGPQHALSMHSVDQSKIKMANVLNQSRTGNDKNEVQLKGLDKQTISFLENQKNEWTLDRDKFAPNADTTLPSPPNDAVLGSLQVVQPDQPNAHEQSHRGKKFTPTGPLSEDTPEIRDADVQDRETSGRNFVDSKNSRTSMSLSSIFDDQMPPYVRSDRDSATPANLLTSYRMRTEPFSHAPQASQLMDRVDTLKRPSEPGRISFPDSLYEHPEHTKYSGQQRNSRMTSQNLKTDETRDNIHPHSVRIPSPPPLSTPMGTLPHVRSDWDSTTPANLPTGYRMRSEPSSHAPQASQLMDRVDTLKRPSEQRRISFPDPPYEHPEHTKYSGQQRNSRMTSQNLKTDETRDNIHPHSVRIPSPPPLSTPMGTLPHVRSDWDSTTPANLPTGYRMRSEPSSHAPQAFQLMDRVDTLKRPSEQRRISFPDPPYEHPEHTKYSGQQRNSRMTSQNLKTDEIRDNIHPHSVRIPSPPPLSTPMGTLPHVRSDWDSTTPANLPTGYRMRSEPSSHAPQAFQLMDRVDTLKRPSEQRRISFPDPPYEHPEHTKYSGQQRNSRMTSQNLKTDETRDNIHPHSVRIPSPPPLSTPKGTLPHTNEIMGEEEKSSFRPGKDTSKIAGVDLRASSLSTKSGVKQLVSLFDKDENTSKLKGQTQLPDDDQQQLSLLKESHKVGFKDAPVHKDSDQERPKSVINNPNLEFRSSHVRFSATRKDRLGSTKDEYQVVLPAAEEEEQGKPEVLVEEEEEVVGFSRSFTTPENLEPRTSSLRHSANAKRPLSVSTVDNHPGDFGPSHLSSQYLVHPMMKDSTETQNTQEIYLPSTRRLRSSVSRVQETQPHSQQKIGPKPRRASLPSDKQIVRVQNYDRSLKSSSASLSSSDVANRSTRNSIVRKTPIKSNRRRDRSSANNRRNSLGWYPTICFVPYNLQPDFRRLKKENIFTINIPSSFKSKSKRVGEAKVIVLNTSKSVNEPIGPTPKASVVLKTVPQIAADGAPNLSSEHCPIHGIRNKSSGDGLDRTAFRVALSNRRKMSKTASGYKTIYAADRQKMPRIRLVMTRKQYQHMLDAHNAQGIGMLRKTSVGESNVNSDVEIPNVLLHRSPEPQHEVQPTVLNPPPSPHHPRSKSARIQCNRFSSVTPRLYSAKLHRHESTQTRPTPVVSGGSTSRTKQKEKQLQEKGVECKEDSLLETGTIAKSPPWSFLSESPCSLRSSSPDITSGIGDCCQMKPNLQDTFKLNLRDAILQSLEGIARRHAFL